MFDSSDLFYSGSYMDLRGRVLQRLHSARINDQVFELVQNAYDNALSMDNVVLSRVERRRLLAEVLRYVVEDISKRLGQV